jgi:alkylation response protein AidB-like acyl-CoA dehydrogenase
MTDFGLLQMDDSTNAFCEEVEAFCDTYVTAAVLEAEIQSGDGFDLELHLALGSRGWIVPTWSRERGGADLTPLQAAILSRRLRDRQAPGVTLGTTMLALPAVARWGPEDLKAEILPSVARGDTRICLGYSEPGSGSDIAAAITRANRDGDEWVIDGQKMFTTGAQQCQYAFLLTRTNSAVAKHRGLTMFLCPLEQAEIRGIQTMSGERTNLVFFDSVRISDKFRLGEVDHGWSVLLDPLNAEHAMPADDRGPSLESPGGQYGQSAVIALDAAIRWAGTPRPDGSRPLDDPFVRRRLARAAVDVEAATSSTGPAGRVMSAEVAIRVGTDLIDLVGQSGLLPLGADGAIEDGWLEYCHRFGPGTAIYGGTTEVFRNIIAERVLMLPRSVGTNGA